VELGQGYLLGKPAFEPAAPRKVAQGPVGKRAVAKLKPKAKAPDKGVRRRARVPSRA
jgi:hypothetical protein